MNISRKIGILIFTGVPAIIGGGIVYAAFGHSFTPVMVYEVLLYIGAGVLMIKAS